MLLNNSIDAWGISFGAAPPLLLIGCCCIIFIIYRTAFVTCQLGASTKPSVSASEDDADPPQTPPRGVRHASLPHRPSHRAANGANDNVMLTPARGQHNVGIVCPAAPRKTRLSIAIEIHFTGLRDICQSNFLSEHILHQRLPSRFHQVYDPMYHSLLFDICRNEHLTLGILQCFIEFFPLAVRAVDEIGRTPLHLVCWNKNVTLDIFRCLVEACPDTLQTQDVDGYNPLHCLCSNSALDEDEAVEILSLLIERCPESVRCRVTGLLPIHVAIRKCSPKFCLLLVDAFPDSVINRDEHDEREITVLTDVIYRSLVDDSAVALALLKMLVEKYPDMIRRFRDNPMGSLLNIVAASRDTSRSVEVCRLLAHNFPELVRQRSGSGHGRTPLHIACINGNLAVAKCIIDMSPNAIYDECGYGQFPIHFAVNEVKLLESPEKAVELVKFLLTVNASVASQRVSGTVITPLMMAAYSYRHASNLIPCFEVIEPLYNAYPEAIYASDIIREAIDNARAGGATDVVEFLDDQLSYAETARDLQLVRTQDEHGYLPLHIALHEQAPLGTIKLFVEADLSTLQTPTTNGNTLLHEACRLRNYGVIEMILTRYPTAQVCTKNWLGKLPIQVLIENDNDEPENADYLNSIFLLLRANPAIWMSGTPLVSD